MEIVIYGYYSFLAFTYPNKKFSISRGTYTDTHSVSYAVSFSVTQTDGASKVSVINKTVLALLYMSVAELS